MKHATGHGFLLSFLINMFFRAWWLVFVAILLVLHFTVGWSLWLIAIPIGFWAIHSLIVTLILCWGNSCSSEPRPERENKNPYSAKTSDLFKSPR